MRLQQNSRALPSGPDKRPQVLMALHVFRASSLAILFPVCAIEGVSAQTISSAVTSFKNDVQPIFNANCVVCRQGSGAPEGLILEDGKAYGSIVGRPSRQAPLPLITPRSVTSSYLLHKLAGTQTSAHGRGERMPLGSDLNPAEFATIRDWVLAGAKDN